MEQCSAYTAKGERCQLPAVKGSKFCHIHLRQKRLRYVLTRLFSISVTLAALSFIANVTGILGFFGIQPRLFQSPQGAATPTPSLIVTHIPAHTPTAPRVIYPQTTMTGPTSDGTAILNAVYTPEPSKIPTSVQCTEPETANSSLSVTSTATVGTVVEISIKVVQTPCTQVTALIIDGNIVFESEKAEFTYYWDTSNYSEGEYTIRVEVKVQGETEEITSQVGESKVILILPPTPTPCAAPSIERLVFDPNQSSPVGTNVTIHAKATWNPCFRAMRLKIDGGIVYELGAPEFTYNWNTSSYSLGDHNIRLEVAAWGDNSWNSPSILSKSYTLISGIPPTPTPCTPPPIENLSFEPNSPSPVGTNVTIHAKATWNPCFRAMRLKIDGGIVYELGAPEFTYNWNTSGYSIGEHNIRLEVAALGDNSWIYPSVQTAKYTLQ